MLRHQITNMRMVPLKRNYAFELPEIRHGEQWVMKVMMHAVLFLFIRYQGSSAFDFVLLLNFVAKM